ncbi:MAG: hypothetical protein IPN90_00705 [Elusimicrobia bacterium]|nr:hypothetical protein [Elusimicrobiota bacterium]
MVYSVDNLFDGELDTVWAEGAPGYGEGTTITFTFDTPPQLTGLWFSNGHQRDDETFDKNGKLREVSFAGETYTLKNESGLQIIPLKKAVQDSTFELKILSHYPGTKIQDLCLTEMGFKSETPSSAPKRRGRDKPLKTIVGPSKINTATPFGDLFFNMTLKPRVFLSLSQTGIPFLRESHAW